MIFLSLRDMLMQQKSYEWNLEQNISIFVFLMTDIDLATITDRMAVKKPIQSGNIEDAIEKVNDLNLEDLGKTGRENRIQIHSYFSICNSKVIIFNLICLKCPLSDKLPPLQQSFLEELERIVALLAFEDVNNSPVGDLLDISQHLKPASEVNDAILTNPKLTSLLRMLLWSQNQLNEKAAYPRITDQPHLKTPLFDLVKLLKHLLLPIKNLKCKQFYRSCKEILSCFLLVINLYVVEKSFKDLAYIRCPYVLSYIQTVALEKPQDLQDQSTTTTFWQKFCCPTCQVEFPPASLANQVDAKLRDAVEKEHNAKFTGHGVVSRHEALERARRHNVDLVELPNILCGIQDHEECHGETGKRLDVINHMVLWGKLQGGWPIEN
uniref:CRA domain-containing protein n=1 Tax=Lactuca sativa TaxID=4236 RepID=A0A9R1UQ47_LACSA|nr:hypothetical protein LSAT_V11C800438600 [Lactuca sativa]